jgi:hypothetical protein
MAQRGTTIDMAELERLSAMQCTDEEIAAWFKVTTHHRAAPEEPGLG